MTPGKVDIKLIDFGSSCFRTEILHTYIQSRYYRAPEVFLQMAYGPEIDVWSAGCVMAELYLGYPLFPGENETEQMALIVAALGLPPPGMFSQPRSEVFFNHRRELRFDLASAQRKLWHMFQPLAVAVPEAGFRDLLARMLTW